MAATYQVLQLIAAIAFGLVGAAAVVDWLRFRGRGRASLALALGSLGLVSIIGQVTAHVHGLSTVLSFLTIPLFLASGYGLLLFRNELMPYRRAVFVGATALVALTLVVFLAAVVVAGPRSLQQSNSNQADPVLLAAALLLIAVWGMCIGEPAISLAIASRGRPAVQRARISSLSLAYGLIVLVLVVDIAIASLSGFKQSNYPLQIVTEAVILATAPLMYFSFSPPAVLRRFWRGREEDALRRALHDLLLGTPNRGELADKALGWALRLVGAEGGLIADGTQILTLQGLEPERAEELRKAGGDLDRSGPIPAAGPGSAYRVPLSLAEGTGSVVLVTGPFTPVFGADEYARMSDYCVSLAAAMDRAALVQELRHNQASLELRVAERTSELEASNKELEAFSYTVSHDLRQPLRAIDGFARALEESLAGVQLGEQAQHYLDSISRNAQNMGRLIDALLGFSRLSRQPLVRRQVAPSALARHAADAVLEGANGGAPTITIADLPECRADPTLLQQVYGNLIANAVKFSSKQPQPTIEVGWQPAENGRPVYFVRDNGAGFDMKYVDKLFGVFQRLHSVRDYEGSGAGLAIVQRIVHRHGGRVWAEGEVGRGATFYFTVGAED